MKTKDFKLKTRSFASSFKLHNSPKTPTNLQPNSPLIHSIHSNQFTKKSPKISSFSSQNLTTRSKKRRIIRLHFGRSSRFMQQQKNNTTFSRSSVSFEHKKSKVKRVNFRKDGILVIELDFEE